MTARIFIHPRCTGGPAAGACAAYLASQGYDMAELAVFFEARTAPYKSRFELVRRRGDHGVNQEFERMDMSIFHHRLGEINEGPQESA